MQIIINHKTNFTFEEIKTYEKKLRKYSVIVLPTMCYMSLFTKGKYELGSQDISEFNETNRTGEVTGQQLRSLNSKYCLIGHSDRRIHNNETNEIILKKLKNCFLNNIIPIYCFGEQNTDNNLNYLKQQIDLVLLNYKNNNIIFAYEPVKNIGNNDPNLYQINENLNAIKNYCKEKYDYDIKLIYGGGINNSNIEYIKNINTISGIIISTESLNIDVFKRLYEKTKE